MAVLSLKHANDEEEEEVWNMILIDTFFFLAGVPYSHVNSRELVGWLVGFLFSLSLSLSFSSVS